MTVPNPANTRAYPMPAPADDRRFTLGLFFDIAKVLADHGYPPITAGGDLVELQQVIYGFLYAAAASDNLGGDFDRALTADADMTPPPASSRRYPAHLEDAKTGEVVMVETSSPVASQPALEPAAELATTMVDTWRRDDCPDWCVRNHAGDDRRVDIVRHEAAPHDYGIRVTRCDCPSTGTIGKPVLYVRVEAEIDSWEQAGRLANALLDGVDYLIGADQ